MFDVRIFEHGVWGRRLGVWGLWSVRGRSFGSFMGVAAGRRDHGLRRDASATRVEASAYFLRDFSSVSAMDSSADAASATEISQVAVMRRLAEIL